MFYYKLINLCQYDLWAFAANHLIKENLRYINKDMALDLPSYIDNIFNNKAISKNMVEIRMNINRRAKKKNFNNLKKNNMIFNKERRRNNKVIRKNKVGKKEIIEKYPSSIIMDYLGDVFIKLIFTLDMQSRYTDIEETGFSDFVEL